MLKICFNISIIHYSLFSQRLVLFQLAHQYNVCVPTDCDYDGVLVRNGETFTPVDARCDRCTCEGGTVECALVTCPDPGPCSHTAVLDGECCPSCLDCGNRPHGDTWRETACQQCTCVVSMMEDTGWLW